MSSFFRLTVDEIAVVLVVTVIFFMPRIIDAASGSEMTPAEASVTATATATTDSSPRASSSPTEGRSTESSTRNPDSCDFRDEIDRVREATVLIIVELGDGRAAYGSGFHLGGGRYLSAAHVVLDDAGGRTAGAIWVESAATGRRYPAEVVSIGGISSTGWGRDMVLLSAEEIPSAIDWRAPAETDVDRDVRVLGYPWSQEDDGPTLPPPLVVRGTLAFIGNVEGIDVVQSSARAEEGMSGGPLVDECGTAIALVTGARFQVNDVGALREGFAVFVSMSEFERLP